ILSTCNRTEVYATVHRFHPAVNEVRTFLSDVSGVSQDRIADGLYTYYDTSAVHHLFNVASGTDSMVVGEPQSLGQVREAFRAAADNGGDDIVIANRTASKARNLASALGARGVGLDELGAVLPTVDVVVCVTSAPEPVLDVKAIAAVGRPVVLIDLGMPRNIDP